jgi:uncharacterized RDD family membrane protein YckC
MQPASNPNLIAKRVAATLVDYFIIFGLTFIYLTYFGEEVAPGEYRLEGFAALLPAPFWAIYFVVAEGLYGATLGHALFYLVVRQANGNEIDFTQAVKRRVADILDFHLTFGLLAFFLVRQTPLHQRLGDSWAETIVVDKRSFFKINKYNKS